MTPILDHGYLSLIEHWGSDARIIEAARMSTDKGFKGWGEWLGNGVHTHYQENRFENGRLPAGVLLAWERHGRPETLEYGHMRYTKIHFEPGDEKLLAYLYKHRHATPFEMAGLIIEVKAPIFVFREWHRHRTQSYNEMSARYVPMPDENYIPSVERLLLNSKTNKQAGVADGSDPLTPEAAKSWQQQLEDSYRHAEATYQRGLADGVPKELARLSIPVARYSKMRASANLRNWLAFLTLRMDEKAQWEIREYANEVGRVIEQCFPRTWELFIEGKK